MIEKIVEPLIVKIVGSLINSFYPYDPNNPLKRFNEILEAYKKNVNFLEEILKNEEGKKELDKLIKKIKEIGETVDLIISPFGYSYKDFPKIFKKSIFRKFLSNHLSKKNPDIADLLKNKYIQEWLYINIKEMVRYIWEKL